MAYTTIDDPSAYFQTLAYTASTATPSQTFTNDGNSDLKPDLLWVKNRSGWGSRNHVLWDSSRGTNANLTPNETTAEQTTSYQTFNTNGFTVPEGFATAYSAPYVAWQWKANGGTTASNTDGTITSTVQFNSDAGFSIQTFTSASSGNSNWGHGLGVTPDVFIVKRRDGSSSWWGHWKGTSRTAGSGNNWQYMPLNSTAAATSLSTFKADSTTITTANDFVPNSASMLCYAFAEKQGYSKFGKYVGNGSNTNGTFIYTGFKPAFIMSKRTDAAGHGWFIWDTKRAPHNLVQAVLYPNSSAAESSLFQIDILSNGFKHYNNYGRTNPSGGQFIYMAFAEQPFVTSTGIPTTAR